MAYSCALLGRAGAGDPARPSAQRAKLDLICRKLGLEPGRRCWTSAAAGDRCRCTPPEPGAQVTGVTLSRRAGRLHPAGRPRRAGEDRVRGPAAGLPRGHWRRVRRGRLGRDGRARRRGQVPGVLRRAAAARCGPAAGCWSSRCPGRPGRPAAARSSSPTSRRTCTCGRSARRSAARGGRPRGARRAGHARALRADDPGLAGELRGQLPRISAILIGEQVRVWRLYLAGGALAFERAGWAWTRSSPQAEVTARDPARHPARHWRGAAGPAGRHLPRGPQGGKHSVVDTAWGIGIALAALTAFLVSGWLTTGGHGDTTRRALLLAASVLWGLRLAAYVGRRNHGQPEDPRYADMLRGHTNRTRCAWSTCCRRRSCGWPPSRSSPACCRPPVDHSPWPARPFAVGLAFESVGDWQLARFKANPANGPDHGPRPVALHPAPELLRRLLHVVGTVRISAGSWRELPARAGACDELHLTCGTGARMTDRRMAASRPQYADYVARTSGFIPLPPAPNGRRNGVPQPQLRGKGPEEGLPGQPGKVSAARVVREQRDRHAERFLAAPEGLDPGHQVQPPRPVQLPPDPAVRGRSALAVRPGVARLAIAARNRSRYAASDLAWGHDPARRPEAGRVWRAAGARAGGEGHQVPRRPRPGEQQSKPGRGEDPLAERLAQPGVVQPPLVLHGQQRSLVSTGPRTARARRGRGDTPAVPRDGPDAAARRLGLEDVPSSPARAAAGSP